MDTPYLIIGHVQLAAGSVVGELVTVHPQLRGQLGKPV